LRAARDFRKVNVLRPLQSALARFFGVSKTAGGLPRVIRISVLNTGRILLDGREVNMSDLRGALEKAKERREIVWFYRQSGGDKPPAEAVEVFQLIVTHQVPVSLSTKPDFSDYLDDGGVSQPRK
jgi:hypothetical protein